MAVVRSYLIAGFAGALALGAVDATGQELPSDQAAVTAVGNCIRVARIRAMDVLDDRRIRLEMDGGPDILMRLERKCPQLRFHGFFTYEPTMGQICAAIDHIVTRAGAQCVIEGFSADTGEKSAPDGEARGQEPPS